MPSNVGVDSFRMKLCTEWHISGHLNPLDTVVDSLL
jgi:hypothetical protein